MCLRLHEGDKQRHFLEQSVGKIYIYVSKIYLKSSRVNSCIESKSYTAFVLGVQLGVLGVLLVIRGNIIRLSLQKVDSWPHLKHIGYGYNRYSSFPAAFGYDFNRLFVFKLFK